MTRDTAEGPISEFDAFLATTADELLALMSTDTRDLAITRSIAYWIDDAQDDPESALDPISLTEMLLSLEAYARDRIRAHDARRPLDAELAAAAQAADLAVDRAGAFLVLRAVVHMRAVVIEAHPVEGHEIVALAASADIRRIMQLAAMVSQDEVEAAPTPIRLH